mgnify:CR=1 FL=1
MTEEEKSLSRGLRMCYNKDNKQDEEVINMRNPLIITIGREYGSGGREIGELVAKTPVSYTHLTLPTT